jgi:large exoprotein involved in heme utilization and adhesion
MPLANSGTGDGGDLRVDAATIEVQGVNPFLTLGSLLGTQTLGFGDGGQTTIQTETLRVLDGGTVTSGTAAAGNAGQLVIRADDLIQVEGRGDNGLRSSIGSYASAADITLQRAFFLPRLPTGDTGGLEIQTDRLNVLDGGLVSVQHQGPGNAGQMRVQADTIRLEGGALTAETASGQGGDIQLQVADRLQLVQQSRITAEARGNGDGGNLDIEAGLITATPSENNDMIANATSGAGGQIRIRTQGLLGLTYREQLTPDNDITASSQFGIDGTVTITTLTDPAQRATELSETPADSEPPTVATCGSADTAPLALVGRGGLPVDPRQVLPGQVMVQDLRSSPDRPSVSTPETVSPSNPVTPSPVIEEAQGWQVNAAGQVELTAGRSEDLLPFIACQSIAP